jgi:xanthine dehydrogenase/oxidase
LYIDISSVAELTTKEFDGKSLVLGANTTLTEAIEIFTQIAKDNPNFAYLKLMADHIDLIANVPVRNRGTLAGNLMIKHDHNDFPSDIFLILETAGALLTVGTNYLSKMITK